MSFRPPSFDPRSPSYDPSAASPCNPFPTSSPFATFAFPPPHGARSGLEFEMDADPDFEPTPQPSPSPTQLTTLAHIPPPHSAPALRRTKPCRFYLSPSGCKTGRWCNFKHPVGAGAGPDGDTNSGSVDALHAAVARSRGDPSDTSVWDNIPDVRDLNPDWGKKSDDEVHPKFRTQPCRNYLLGLCRYGTKCQFIHAPGLFAPGGAEVPTSLPIPVAPVPVSVWGAHPGVGASPTEAGPSTRSEQMSLYYRTKPCKFFNANGSCPHGADCKFIHDPKKAPAPSWADDDRELDFGEVPLFNSGAMDDVTNRAGSRRAAVAEREKERESGIYKPLWRVVGGGVKIGKADVPMHEEEVEADDAVLEYQPHDMNALAPTVIPDFATTSPLRTSPPLLHHSYTQPPSPVCFTYTPFDPAQYPPHALLRAPSPTDMPLDITMGSLDADPGPVIVRKRRVITGADLLRGLGDGEKERQKPRLTIEVPTRTADGDDLLDWGMEDEDGVELGEDKRRVQSTPPTPRSSASYLDVPILPRLPAESP